MNITAAREATFRAFVLCLLVLAPAVRALPSGVDPETLQKLLLPLPTALEGEKVLWTL
jgi:hypothetical protein